MTPGTAATPTIRHHDAAGALALRREMVTVYAAAHDDLMDDPWFHPDRFWQRLVDLYAPTRDFGMVSAWRDEEMVGYAFGSPRDDGGQLWNTVRDHLPDLPPTGVVYIFREFAVSPAHQRRGYGRRVHDALLATRPEQVAHLLVRPDNVPAQHAYRAWRWTRIGQRQPFPDSPALDAMVLRLPVETR